MASPWPHLNPVELGEEAQALGHSVGRAAALPGHVVHGQLQVVQQLALQEEDRGSGPASCPPLPQLTQEPGAPSACLYSAPGAWKSLSPPEPRSSSQRRHLRDSPGGRGLRVGLEEPEPPATRSGAAARTPRLSSPAAATAGPQVLPTQVPQAQSTGPRSPALTQ